MTKFDDADDDERELLEELEQPMRDALLRTAGCPDPAAISAAGAGALPDNLAASLSAHLRECPACRILARDLAATDAAAPTPGERARILARVAERSGGPGLRLQTRDGLSMPSRRWRWDWGMAGAVTLAVVAVAVAVWAPWRRAVSSPTTGAVARPAPGAVPAIVDFVLPLQKPAVAVSLGGALTWRGASTTDGERRLAQLRDALAPYEAGNYAEAARRLDALAGRTDAADVRFYLGVSHLFLGATPAAVDSLTRARRGAPAWLLPDASWYLAVALERAGRVDEAKAELRTLCADGGELRAGACRAAERLGAPRN